MYRIKINYSCCYTRPKYKNTVSSLDPCDAYQCANRGRCNVINGMPRCLCPPGYKGTHCEKKGNFDNNYSL